ncbi:MFS monosaccharide transporter [Meredithblackwellia eburnea MCA 4105]
MAPQQGRGIAILMTCFAAIGGGLYGYDTGYISGVKEMAGFLHYFGEIQANGKLGLSSSRDSLITSILSAGTFFGSLLAYFVGDFMGRRWGIIIYLGIFCLGVALQTAGTTLPRFVLGRVFAGIGLGGTSTLVPMYQSECAPKAIRGAIVAAYQWMITIGLLIASVVVNATKDRQGPSSFQIPIGLQFIWAVILGGGLAFLPESPRYLIMKGRDEEAMKALARMSGDSTDSPAVATEFSEIAANIHHQRSVGSGSYADCFSMGPGKNALRVGTGIGLQALQQLTGINFIFYYGTTFFKNSGISNPFMISIATNVVNVGMTVPGIWAVDKVGRRALLLYGAAGMAIAQLIVAAVGDTVKVTNLAGQKVLIAFVCIYIAHFAATWGPLAWVVTGEIYPTSIRAKAMSMSTASNWLWNFGIGYATPYLVDSGPGKAGLHSNVFFLWGAFCVICCIYVYFFIPETKGLSLEQVDLLYRNSTIRGSNQYRQKILAENMHDEDTEAYKEAKGVAPTSHLENVSTEDKN